MAFRLTAEEYDMVAALPIDDLVDFAIELDIPVGEEFDRIGLYARCIESLAGLAAREGLPFSHYDKEDLLALPPAHRQALTRQLALADSVEAILKSGRKVYKFYNKRRRRSQIPLMLPLLLRPLCRYLAEQES